MRKTYREYHIFTTREMESIWPKALIVIDTNALLDFYCFGDKTLEDYYRVLENIKSRNNLWMPHQVGYEFYENRVRIINKQLKQYENIISYIDATRDKILALANTLTGHAQLDFEDIADQYESKVKPIKTKIQNLQNKHPDHFQKDAIIERLEKIFTDDIVGSEFSQDQIESLIKEGEVRYAKNIPPGYKDRDKQDTESRSIQRKFGDLIIWKQIIDKARGTTKPVIFITNDTKEDWMIRTQDKRKLGAKSLLRKELLKEVGVDFFIFSSDEFLDEAHKQFNLDVNASSVDEVKKYREIEDSRIRKVDEESLNPKLNRLLSYSALHFAIRCLKSLEHDNVPQRAILTMQEIVDSYHRVYSMRAHGHYEFMTIEEFEKINYLLRRCRHILKDFNPSYTHQLDELDRLNGMLISETSMARMSLGGDLSKIFNIQ